MIVGSLWGGGFWAVAANSLPKPSFTECLGFAQNENAVFFTDFCFVASPFPNSRSVPIRDLDHSTLSAEGRKWGVRSVVVEFGAFGAPRFSVQRPQNPLKIGIWGPLD